LPVASKYVGICWITAGAAVTSTIVGWLLVFVFAAAPDRQPDIIAIDDRIRTVIKNTFALVI
jgi:hypothetical protein